MRPANELNYGLFRRLSSNSITGSTVDNFTLVRWSRQIHERHVTPGFPNSPLLALSYDLTFKRFIYGRDIVKSVTRNAGSSYSDLVDSPSFNVGVGPLPSGLATLMSNNDAILRTKALLKVKDLKVNLAQAFAERKQTSALILNTVFTLSNAFRKLKRFDVVGCADALGVKLHPRKQRRLLYEARSARLSYERELARLRKKGSGPPTTDGLAFAANKWLEYKFGWVPLLQDVYGSAEMLAKFHVNGTRSHTRVSAIHEQSLPSVQSSYPSGYSGRTSDTGTMKVKSKIGFRFYADDSIWSETPNMGLTDPALLAWELIPYSFVVDWFLPIGDFLGALNARQGFIFKDGFINHFATGDSVRVITDSHSVSAGTYSYQMTRNARHQETTYRHKREALLDFPLPFFPSVENPYSASHLATALALLKQTFRVR